jgi:hypothetical protein
MFVLTISDASQVLIRENPASLHHVFARLGILRGLT